MHWFFKRGFSQYTDKKTKKDLVEMNSAKNKRRMRGKKFNEAR